MLVLCRYQWEDMCGFAWSLYHYMSHYHPPQVQCYWRRIGPAMHQNTTRILIEWFLRLVLLQHVYLTDASNRLLSHQFPSVVMATGNVSKGGHPILFFFHVFVSNLLTNVQVLTAGQRLFICPCTFVSFHGILFRQHLRLVQLAKLLPWIGA